MTKKTNKCKLCKKEEERFNTLEFGAWNQITWDDWKVEKTLIICKNCKKKIEAYIEKFQKEDKEVKQ